MKKTYIPLNSKLSIFVMLSGVLVFFTYLLYDQVTYGDGLLVHILTIDISIETFFHMLIVGTLVASFVTGYLINERAGLLKKTSQSEDKLKSAAHEWLVTFDSIPYGILLTDKDFNIVRANKFIANLYGISFSEILSKKCHNVFCHNDSPPSFCPVLSVLATDKTENTEYFDLKNKKVFTESITPLSNGSHEATSYVHVIIDITESKGKEDKLIKSKDAFFNMLKDLDSTNRELLDTYNNLVVTLSNIIDAKSSWTNGHSTNVAFYAIAIAQKMGLSEHELEVLNIAALLHDIGKIGTYDVTLDKPGKLTDKEFDLIKKHPAKGEEILKPIKGLEEILPIIRSHHEKLDGSGYPDGLKGDKLPKLARIISVADSYDAMISDRPYRPSRGKDFAIGQLKEYSGTQFDCDVVRIFIGLLEKELSDTQHSPLQNR